MPCLEPKICYYFLPTCAFVFRPDFAVISPFLFFAATRWLLDSTPYLFCDSRDSSVFQLIMVLL